jgi:phospholipid/cholesterol/gamma-HCH transport system ATP-binding protein
MSEEVTIAYEDVHKRFDTPVLSGVSLSVMRGETISILGTSGTGKSVLLKTTIGLIVPDQGDVKIDGESVYHSSRTGLRDLRRAVRYVFQYAALFDSLNIYDNVAMGLDPETIKTLDRRVILERIAASLENVNLDPGKVLSKLPAELSGGMRKRVGIARAIALRPKYLLYDEPTTGLDPITTDYVDTMIDQAKERLGVTSMVISHDIASAFKVADRLAVLYDGRIAAQGTPAEVKASADPYVRKFLELWFGKQ